MPRFRLYVSGVEALNGPLDWARDAFRVLFVTGAYEPDQETHRFRSDIGQAEAAGEGYPPGGFLLTARETRRVAREVELIAAGISAPIVGGPFRFRYAVVYHARGGAARVDELIGFADFGEQAVADRTVNLDFDENVVAAYAVAA